MAVNNILNGFVNMLKLKLDVYSGNVLQSFVSVLTQCESEGLTDIVAIRDKINANLHSRMTEVFTFQDSKSRRLSRHPVNALDKCPECSKGRLSPVINSDGLDIIGCNICRYSEIREENNVK